MTILISNTRITAKNTCDKLHDYMYNQQLEPRQHSIRIRRGNAGHLVLKAYYECLRDGWNHPAAVGFALDVFFEDLIPNADPEDFEYMEALGHLRWLLGRYFQWCADDATKYKIVAVEEVYTAPMDSDINFGIILDVLAEKITGEHRGSFDIIDHKFVDNFKSLEDLRIDGQQPKYWKTLDLNGIPVKNALFNQIRYRKMKDPSDDMLFRRSPILSTTKAISNIWDEATNTADEIYAESVSGVHRTRRTLSQVTCKWCFFQKLCMTELAGEDSTILRQIEYKKRVSPLRDWMLSSS